MSDTVLAMGTRWWTRQTKPLVQGKVQAEGQCQSWVLWEHMGQRASPAGKNEDGSPEAVITKLRSEG